jgi:LemA protein
MRHWFARLAALAFVAVALSACGVNNVPRLDEETKAAWSQVLNQYQRRADLVPNLVETVKGYAAHERGTLEAVVEARARATQAQINIPADVLTNPDAFRQFQAAQAALSGSLGRLLATVENYPDLKASQNFMSLQAQLEGTENRIAVARRDYIVTVQAYNTELRTIPGRWIAAILYPDAKVKQTFDIPAESQAAPQVSDEPSDEGRHDDGEAAHRGRALLGQRVALGRVFADRRLGLLGFEPADDALAEQKRDQQGGHHGAARAEREIAEHVERRKFVGEGNEQIEEHGRVATFRRRARVGVAPARPRRCGPCGCR